MKGNFGRKRQSTLMVVTGNGKGIVGFALGKGLDIKGIMRLAKKKAAQRLMHFPIYNDHTGILKLR